MVVKSEYYPTWDEYKETHPEISDIENAEKLKSYEDQVFNFVIRLFR